MWPRSGLNFLKFRPKHVVCALMRSVRMAVNKEERFTRRSMMRLDGQSYMLVRLLTRRIERSLFVTRCVRLGPPPELISRHLGSNKSGFNTKQRSVPLNDSTLFFRHCKALDRLFCSYLNSKGCCVPYIQNIVDRFEACHAVRPHERLRQVINRNSRLHVIQ